MTQSFRYPTVEAFPASDDCSLDDAHRAIREAHNSHGLSNGACDLSFRLSANLTATAMADDRLVGEEKECVRRGPPLPTKSTAAPFARGLSTGSRKRSISIDDCSVVSAAPSVLRQSGLADAVASTNLTAARLDAFLRRNENARTGTKSDQSCYSFQSELNRLGASERELNGLWAREDGGESIGSWKMAGTVASSLGDGCFDCDGSVISVTSHRSTSVMGRFEMVAPTVGRSFVRGCWSSDSDEQDQAPEIPQNCGVHVNDLVEEIDIQSRFDELSILSMDHDRYEEQREVLTQHHKLNEKTDDTYLTPVDGKHSELDAPASPIGTDISFSSSSTHSVDDEVPLSYSPSPKPMTKSYPEESTGDDDDDFFYDSVMDISREERSLYLHSLSSLGISPGKENIERITRKNCCQYSSLIVLLRLMENLAEKLYGW
uniref:Uncharacterized protein n=1 Tax=Pseudictyota dubia TaxID=2749911 RepID=A0A7R9W3G6_9STRA|mmetsp:Transcript_30557/g.56599  ORF Transcript_30557/g.56599 Transcript_30557/m.56599 type:complete len:432 (+) Transcript_30557:285-1580(+)|eukprot:CAMPEP_0197452704 /NCGR_PEP_ID=MMETSP1175-20131217/32748_1 /TAXON_ID=1003142 /ORGANISM="Triceratium dubium, Strain CCMP147" /LENGTH=431 /DNA_ID=CAMNT_0042985771 /DNA_START=283 /DNA_END=1578 /DNA_ORIENTATION=+